jgi:hypothetical protein
MKAQKGKIVGILTVILSIIVILVIMLPVFPYEPIIARHIGREIHLISDTSLHTPDHLDRIEHVLTYYDERYWRISSKQVYICLTLFLNRELAWNYTTKAEDSGWLRNHPVK